MAKVKDTDLSTGKLKPNSSKKWKWSIKVDDLLLDLLFSRGIDDPEERKLICDVLYDLGLVEYKEFSEDTDTLEAEEHHFTSTEAMRKLVRKGQL